MSNDKHPHNGPREREPRNAETSESTDVEPLRENGSAAADTESAQELAETVTMLKASLSQTKIALPDKQNLLEDVFARAAEVKQHSSVQRDRAQALGDMVDALLDPTAQHSGKQPLAEIQELAMLCRMIHSAATTPALGYTTRRRLLETVTAQAAQPSLRVAARAQTAAAPPQAAPTPAASTRARNVWMWTATALAAGLAAMVVALAVHRFAPPSTETPKQPSLIRKTARQRIAHLVPGPFPPQQSATDRADLLYSDRLHAHRFQMIEWAPRKTDGVKRSVAGRASKRPPRVLSHRLRFACVFPSHPDPAVVASIAWLQRRWP